MGQRLTPALRCGAGYLGQGAAIDVQALVGVKVASSMVSVDYAPARHSAANGVRGGLPSGTMAPEDEPADDYDPDGRGPAPDGARLP